MPRVNSMDQANPDFFFYWGNTAESKATLRTFLPPSGIQDETIELNGLTSTSYSGIRERDNVGRSEVDNIYDNIVKHHKAIINAEYFDIITLNISLG